jgi:hypothetical protein
MSGFEILRSRCQELDLRCYSMMLRLISLLVALLQVASLWAATASSTNFVVTASSAEFAQRVAQDAEKHRRRIALELVGKEYPAWAKPCPIQVMITSSAGGRTSFIHAFGQVFGWNMTVQGTEQAILDNVLPHEVGHTGCTRLGDGRCPAGLTKVTA